MRFSMFLSWSNVQADSFRYQLRSVSPDYAVCRERGRIYATSICCNPLLRGILPFWTQLGPCDDLLVTDAFPAPSITSDVLP